MFLSRLELYGFKSFPNRVGLAFEKGVTTVVGPNGSGKSNIADAIRWVLGEQSAKSLRGAKMEDVIFAGTKTRRALGMAEVALTIDNQDGAFGGGFSEIIITRRLFRTGESQYFINGAACRLKDIHELFADTGLGKEGYSIIGQGRIDEILSQKSDERRLALDEAAGIVKFKIRRAEAEAKLFRERQNLLRVEDMLTELGARLPLLKEQAAAARVFMDLAERQKQIEISIILAQIEKCVSDTDALTDTAAILNAQASDSENALEKAKADVSEQKEKLEKLNIEYEQSNSTMTSLRVEREKAASRIQLLEQQNRYASDEIENLEKRAEALTRQLDTDGADMRELEAFIERGRTVLAEKNATIGRTQSELENLSAALTDAEKFAETALTEHIELLNRQNAERSRLSRAESTRQQIESRAKQLSEEIEDAQSRQTRNHDAKRRAEDDIAEWQARAEGLAIEARKLSERANEIRERQSRVSDRISALEKELNTKRTRRKLLEELETDLDGYNRAVQTVLRARKTDKGIHGAIGELITTDASYETAIEIALGFAVQNIVVDDEDTAKRMIETLKRAKAGRATFLPLTAGRHTNGLNESLLRETGVIGAAIDLVKFDERYSQILRNLLARVVVVDTMQNAINFCKKSGYNYKTVTLSGELFNTGGAITGGSMRESGKILGRAREITELRGEENGLNEQIATLRTGLPRFNEENAKIKVERDANQAALSDAERVLLTRRMELKRAADENAALERNLEQKRIEEKQLAKQIEISDKQIAECERLVAQIVNEIEQLNAKLQQAQLDARETKTTREQQMAALSTLRIEAAREQAELDAAEARNRDAVANAEESRKAIGEAHEQVAVKKTEIEQNLYIIEETQKQSSEMTAQLTALETQTKAQNRERETLLATIAYAERDVTNITSTLARIHNEQNRQNLKLEQLQSDKQRLYNALWDDHGITYAQAAAKERAEGTIAQLSKELSTLKEKIRELGTVNLAALTEYDSTKERYNFITAQRDDIQLAERKLLQIISEIKRAMEERFLEQLKLISDSFGDVFRKMFGGGEAYLQLTDETNVLESGVDVISSPPGKKLQNMNLFSGGERALTAIALLFGILRLKPAPFCVLDEIEAALDDANVKRFARYISTEGSDSQYIVITHRKGTMEEADTIYGVTMQEQGVSEVIKMIL